MDSKDSWLQFIRRGSPKPPPKNKKRKQKQRLQRLVHLFISLSPPLFLSVFVLFLSFMLSVTSKISSYSSMLVYCTNYNKYPIKLRNDHVFSCFQQIAINSMNSFNIYMYSIFSGLPSRTSGTTGPTRTPGAKGGKGHHPGTHD